MFFQSDANLLGLSAPGVQQELYSYDRLSGGLIEQITNGLADSINPSPDDSGDFVAFQSQADLLGNGSTGWQIYLLDRQRSVWRQVTQGAGDSMLPSLGNASQSLSFVSTADILGTGASGQHLFFYDPRTLRMFQVTKVPGTTSDHPFSAGNFVLFDTDEDIMNTGMTGRQVYSLDTYGRIPKVGLGKRIVNLIPQGQLQLDIGDRDARSEAPIALKASEVKIPPIDLLGYGKICLAASANGAGVIDCLGTRPGGDLQITQDHVTEDVDLTCAVPGSCREGTPCRTPLPSPHRTVADPLLGTCNGPIRTARTGVYTPGGMQLTIPVTVSLSLDAGRDTVFCTADDDWVFQNVTTKLELTTGTANATITDANAVVGTTLTETATGSGFDCQRIEAGNFQDAALVGMLPLLDVPTDTAGLQDVVVPVRLSLRAGKPYTPCTSQSCLVLTFCETDLDCADGSVCNGAETCVNHNCTAGTPLACDDNNPCNGTETCDPILGCQSNSPPTCNDGALCTADTCTPSGGCQHTFIPGCCTSNADCRDTDVCNGLERCVSGNCIAGTPLTCDDGNACNGSETCDPTTGCVPGTPPSCADGARCTLDSCNPAPGGGCTHTPIANCCLIDADCRDINICNGDEHCVSGACVAGTPLVCDDGDVCNGLETCNPTSGCEVGTPPTCLDDGARCTDDTCDPLLGCVHTPIPGCCVIDADCQDTNLCNGNETCVGGDCQPGTPPTCDDGDVCNGLETCSPNVGCVPGDPLVCADDGAPCTADTCDPVLGCQHTSIPGCCLTDADCNDTTVCNGLETCVSGDCFAGTPLSCDDGDACNGAEACDDVLGCTVGLITDRFSYEGVKCALDAVDFALIAADPAALGNVRQKNNLLRRMKQIKKNWAYSLPVGTTKVRPKAVRKRLRAIGQKLDTGMRRRIADPDVAGPIRELVNEALVRVDHFDVGATKP